jgi:superfamily II DNA helicase RecQ
VSFSFALRTGQAEVLSGFIRHSGFYHAKMDEQRRADAVKAFEDGTTPIIVATTAFGTGVDFPSISLVILVGIPYSFTDYIQLTGRAGRDGRKDELRLGH